MITADLLRVRSAVFFSLSITSVRGRRKIPPEDSFEDVACQDTVRVDGKCVCKNIERNDRNG